MAKGKKGKGKKKGGGYAVPVRGPAHDAVLADEAVSKRDTLLDDGAAWGALGKQLLGSTIPTADIAAVVMRRDLGGLDTLIARLRGQEVEAPPEPKADPSIEDSVLREAMKAFRKRLKLTKLDHESKLGRSPLSTGRGADFDSILPPHQFPSQVWQTLAVNGELTSTGRGFYMLPKAPPAMRGGG
jgi:hypothetical protein